MKTTIAIIALAGLISVGLNAQSSGKPKVVEGKRIPVLQDLPVLGELFKKQDEKVVPGQPVVSGLHIRPQSPPILKGLPLIGVHSAAKARAEKRIGEPVQMTRDAEGHLPAPRVGFGQRWLRDRLLELEGVQRVEIFERREMALESKSRGDADSRRADKAGSVVIAQRYFRIDAADQAAIKRAEAVIEGHHDNDKDMMIFDVRIVKAKTHSLKDTVVVLEGQEHIVRELLAQDGVEVTSAPQVLVYRGQDAEISLVNRTAYIKDYSVEEVADAVIADPIVATVEHGLRMEMAAMEDPRTGMTHVGFGVKQSSLELPIRVIETKIDVAGTKREVSIQLPDLRFTSMSSDHISLPKSGGEFAIALTKNLLSSDKDEKLIILVKVTPVPVETADFDGTVRGYDAERRLAYVHFDGQLEKGEKVSFQRESTFLGQGRVDRVTGQIALVVLSTAADIRVGDTIAPVGRN